MTNLLDEWIKKASNDLNSAKVLLETQDGHYDQICFLSQQTVEKFLKAYLQKNNAEISKTHDLYKLIVDCSKFNTSFLEWEISALRLTVYSVNFRYPGEDATKESAIKAYELAENFSKFILEEINK